MKFANSRFLLGTLILATTAGLGACELAAAVDPLNCSTCGNVCATPDNASATCANNTCGYTCTTDRADCNTLSTDGCEVHTSVDPLHCGTCGHACGNGGTCAAGVCVCNGTPCTGTQVCVDSNTCG